MTLDIETEAVVGVAHPLDPLSREEISRAVAILRQGPAAAESFRFISIELREPAKEDLRNGAADGPRGRRGPGQPCRGTFLRSDRRP